MGRQETLGRKRQLHGVLGHRWSEIHGFKRSQLVLLPSKTLKILIMEYSKLL